MPEMITLTINEEKPDGSKSIWKLSMKGEIDAPTLIGIFAKIAAVNGNTLEIESLKVKP